MAEGPDRPLPPMPMRPQRYGRLNPSPTLECLGLLGKCPFYLRASSWPVGNCWGNSRSPRGLSQDRARWVSHSAMLCGMTARRPADST
jgi:hypothetical protein